MATKQTTFDLPVIETVEGTVKQQRAAYGAGARQAIADEKRAAIVAGCYLTLGKATFTADETDEWKDWATSVTRKSIKTVDSYIAVAKAFTTSPKAMQGKVKDWTFEALQAFATVDADDRAAVVEAVLIEDSNPSPELVRTARDIARDEKLTEKERNDKAAARAKREKDGKAAKTEAAREQVKSLVGNRKLATLKPRDLMLIGLMVGIAHGEEHGEAGIKSFFIQREAAEKKLAEVASK
jgi:H2-forming N5,N10-methylenetetrahydromethanopterin dehydrogenase-like enzyme